MTEHKLVDETLKRESTGIAARCECGWVSAGHFSSLGASAAMQDHKEQCAAQQLLKGMPQESIAKIVKSIKEQVRDDLTDQQTTTEPK